MKDYEQEFKKKEYEYCKYYEYAELGYKLRSNPNYQILGDNIISYYYYNKSLYASEPKNSGMMADYYYRITLSALKDGIKKAPKYKWDTTKAIEIVRLYGEELLEQEREYYVKKAMEYLERIDTDDNYTILCNGKEAETNKEKVKRL